MTEIGPEMNRPPRVGFTSNAWGPVQISGRFEFPARTRSVHMEIGILPSATAQPSNTTENPQTVSSE